MKNIWIVIVAAVVALAAWLGLKKSATEAVPAPTEPPGPQWEPQDGYLCWVSPSSSPAAGYTGQVKWSDGQIHYYYTLYPGFTAEEAQEAVQRRMSDYPDGSLEQQDLASQIALLKVAQKQGRG